MAPDCWCCTCAHVRDETHEGCATLWDVPDAVWKPIQVWINAWAMSWGKHAGHRHHDDRGFYCPPADVPKCPGYQAAKAA